MASPSQIPPLLTSLPTEAMENVLLTAEIIALRDAYLSALVDYH
ncbi:MAG: hypothetical protein PUP91_08875 [Rhizonema sp. PD37]|nr:hypothetical protein [Rhizonema sp. PD37]